MESYQPMLSRINSHVWLSEILIYICSITCLTRSCTATRVNEIVTLVGWSATTGWTTILPSKCIAFKSLAPATSIEKQRMYPFNKIGDIHRHLSLTYRLLTIGKKDAGWSQTANQRGGKETMLSFPRCCIWLYVLIGPWLDTTLELSAVPVYYKQPTPVPKTIQWSVITHPES